MSSIWTQQTLLTGDVWMSWYHMFDGFEPHCATLYVSQYINTVNASLLVLYMSNNHVYRGVKVADRRFWWSGNTASCQLCCSIVWDTLWECECVCAKALCMHAVLIYLVLHLVAVLYSKLYVSYLLCPAYHSYTAISLFLYSIRSYHQMCIFILFFHQQRLRIAPSLDLV